MIQKKIAVIVVLYNPSQENLDNLSFFTELGFKVFIVDNSKSNREYLFKDTEKYCYKANCENLGIAKALNIAINQAYSEKFEWILTMDQDSTWSSGDLLINYLNDCLSLHIKNTKNVSFGPKLDLPIPYFVEIKKRFFKQKEDDYCNTDRIICSGNLLHIEVWKQLGGFKEELFIDEVDYEFCFRLRKLGFMIIKNNKYIMGHTLGDNHKKTLGIKDSHNSFRLYYMVRNQLYIIKNYSYYAKLYHYKRNLILLLIQKCLFSRERKENIKICKKAKYDMLFLSKGC